MSKLNIASTVKKSYQYSFISNIHKLIKNGYLEVRQHITSFEPEENISGLLRDEIEKFCNEPSAPNWVDGMEIHNERPENSRQIKGSSVRKGKSRQRTDLVFVFTIRPRLRFVFEAKRLNTNHNEAAYCGISGLECFINEEYAREDDIAGMLGYVQDNTIANWNQAILSKTQSHSSHIKNSVPDVILQYFPLEWSSTHTCKSGKLILVYHLLLDCS